jgi:MFS family permease
MTHMDLPKSARGSPLRCRDFRSLWLAAIAFKIGHPIQIVAGVWLMLELSDSALWVGMMTAAPMLPLLILSIPAGAVADARGPRRVLLCAIGAMAVGAFAIAALTAGNIITPLTLLALELVIGMGDAFHVPAWQGSVPHLVPKSILPDAVALEVGAAAVAWAVGPALGGLGIAILGPTATFLVATSTYGVMIAALMRAHALQKERDPLTPIPTAIGSGLRHVRHTPAYRQVLAIAASFGLVAAGLQALLPTFTSKTLNAGAVTYGVLLASMGAGAILGAIARRHASALLSRFMLPVAIAGYGMSGVLIGITRSVPVTGFMLIAAGVAWTWILSTLNASMQLVAPEWVRARVMSVYVAAQFGLLSIGSVLAGGLGTSFGTPAALVLGSLATVGLGIVAARLRLPAPDELDPPKPAGLTPPPPPAWANNQPVTVTTTWNIADDDLPEFLSLTSHLRETCLRSGASRWDLYRDAEHPNEITEVAVFAGWEQYRRLVEQTDIRAVRVIEGIRKLQNHDGPRQRRLIACNGDELAELQAATNSMP